MSIENEMTEGLSDLIEVSGREFFWESGDVTFSALVRAISAPKDERYDYTPTDDDEVLVVALRDAFLAGYPEVGSVLEDDDGSTYRVIRIIRPPNRVDVRFHCAVLQHD